MGDWHREEPLRMSWSAERRKENLSGWLTAFRSRTRVDSLLKGRADGAAGGIKGERVGQARRIGGAVCVPSCRNELLVLMSISTGFSCARSAPVLYPDTRGARYGSSIVAACQRHRFCHLPPPPHLLGALQHDGRGGRAKAW